MTLAAFYHVHEHECALLSLSLLVGARRRQFARDAQEDSRYRRALTDAFYAKCRAEYRTVQQEARAEWARLFTVVN